MSCAAMPVSAAFEMLIYYVVPWHLDVLEPFDVVSTCIELYRDITMYLENVDVPMV